MNERIKQLAKQATTIEYGVDNGFDRVTVDRRKQLEEKIDRLIKLLEEKYVEQGANDV